LLKQNYIRNFFGLINKQILASSLCFDHVNFANYSNIALAENVNLNAQAPTFKNQIGILKKTKKDNKIKKTKKVKI